MNYYDLLELTEDEILPNILPDQNIFYDLNIPFKLDCWYEIVDKIIGNDLIERINEERFGNLPLIQLMVHHK